MFIKEIISQHRRDFTAIYECEHCGKQETNRGYDDRNFHENVVPSFVCGSCDKQANLETYTPMETKYPDGYQI